MASELTPDDVGKMKVAELRAELKARDLSTSGLKKELADRLLEHLAAAGGGNVEEASNGNEAAPETTGAAAPDTGADVPEDAAPSGDSTAHAAGEAVPIPATTEQASTDNLPDELPAIPPATEDSIDDFTGAEGTIAEETATVGVETAIEPSEVHRPPPDHLDKIPGFVADSRVEEAREKAELVPLNEPAVLPGGNEGAHKRKHDEMEEPTISAPEPAVQSVAEQAESSAPANDEITADPAAAAILNGGASSEPEAKRPRTDETAGTTDDIPVPQDSASSLVVEDVTSTMPVDATSTTNGASATSTFPTSISGGASSIGGNGDAPDVMTLNEPQKPAVDFAAAAPGEATASSTGAADASAAGTETKSVQIALSDPDPSSSSHSYPISNDYSCNAHPNANIADSDKAHTNARGDPTDTHSFNIRGASSTDPTSSTTPPKESNPEQMKENNVAPSSSSIPNPSSPTSTLHTTHQNTKDKTADQQDEQHKRPPISRSICISNLVRPFTLPALKEKLEDFGEMDYFWINSIKSHCFVTYQSTDAAQQASRSLEGEIWPEAVGKPLSVTYLPSGKISSLVEKEQAAGRTRLELVSTYDSESNQWQYDVAPPAATTTRPLGQAPPVPRGLASSMPFQAQARAGPTGPGRLDPRNMVTATSASGAPIQLPSNSAFAQSRPPTAASRNMPPSSSAAHNVAGGSGQPWLPKAGAEDLYKKTKAVPELYYRAVDKVAAGRRLRELERGPYAPRNGGGGGGGAGGGDRRAGPSSWFRDSYRP